MTEPLPVILVPGLLGSARLYAQQIPPLWCAGPVMVADPVHDDTLTAMARRILDNAPRVFALAGLSMGGYIAFEILRLAPERVARLALLDTTARPDLPEQTTMRRAQMALAGQGRLGEVVDALFPRLVHAQRHGDAALRATVAQMAQEVGADAFIRQQSAILGRADSRPLLGAIRCPTLVLVGDGDVATPPDRAAEMADGIAGARLVTIPDCGHLSTLEQPEAVTAALLEWRTPGGGA